MKKIGYWGIFFLLLFSCIPSEKEELNVELALRYAGENRQELEKVLEHYRRSPEDADKLKAATFLITHMIGKVYLDSTSIVPNSVYFDALELFLEKQGEYAYDDIYYICDSVQKTMTNSQPPYPRYKADLENISSEFLIAHIDQSFRRWKTHRWSKEVDFDTFCHYILPYKTGSTYWEEAIPYFEKEFSTLATAYMDSSLQAVAKKVDDTIKSTHRMDQTFFAKNFPFLQPMTTRDVMRTRLGVCLDVNLVDLAAMRAMGIPVALHRVQWANSNASHFFSEVITDKKTEKLYDNTQREYTSNDAIIINDMFWMNHEVLPEEGIPAEVEIRHCRTVPKVYRESFAINEANLPILAHGDVPPLFLNPTLEDVTADYLVCEDVEITLWDAFKKEKYAYLARYEPEAVTLDPTAWAPVKRGKALFKDMGINIVYFPIVYSNGQMTPAGDPFILEKEGHLRPLVADTKEKRNGTFLSKVPYRAHILFWASAMMTGGKFKVADRRDFVDSVIVHTIEKIPYYEQNILLDAPQKGRYAVYDFADLKYGMNWGSIADVEFWGLNEQGEEVKLEGKPFGNPGIFMNEIEKAFDGNRVSHFAYKNDEDSFIALDFGKPQTITRIKYSPRSDDNGIVPGELYELYYWNKGWISLGQQVGGDDYRLKYDNLPANALLRIHNHTRGKEHRPFTYDNNKQVWW